MFWAETSPKASEPWSGKGKRPVGLVEPAGTWPRCGLVREKECAVQIVPQNPIRRRRCRHQLLYWLGFLSSELFLSRGKAV
jgi:hypothetical protein